MYLQRRQNPIARAGTRGGVPRRQVLQGPGALGLAATLRPTAVFAEPDDERERLGRLGRGPRQSTSARGQHAVRRYSPSDIEEPPEPVYHFEPPMGVSTARTPLAFGKSGFHSARASTRIGDPQ